MKRKGIYALDEKMPVGRGRKPRVLLQSVKCSDNLVSPRLIRQQDPFCDGMQPAPEVFKPAAHEVSGDGGIPTHQSKNKHNYWQTIGIPIYPHTAPP
jgi:hypothetical protein